MPLPPPETIALLIEADCQALGLTGQNHDFYVSLVTRIFDAVKLATVTSNGVSPPGGGVVVSTSTVIT
jgi:hypothetical protein